MKAERESEIDEHSAAALIGLSVSELRWLCRATGFGRVLTAEGDAPLALDFEEVRKLCLLAARPRP